MFFYCASWKREKKVLKAMPYGTQACHTLLNILVLG
jgi:hypothetical protein